MLLDSSRDARADAARSAVDGDLPPAAFVCLDAQAVEIRPVVLPGPRVREKLAAGVPLLHGEDVAVDPGAVAATWACLLDALATSAEVVRDVERVRAALDDHRLHAEHATVEALVSHPEHVRELAQAAGTPSELVEQLADLAARPVLAAYARQLAPALRLGPWEAGYCPICGAWPVRWEAQIPGGIPTGSGRTGAGPTGDDTTRSERHADGDYQGSDDGRRLRCGRCATGWPAAASDCPFCRHDDPLESLTATARDAPTERRVLGCRACRRYLPVAVGGGDGAPSLAGLAAEAFLASAGRRALHERALARGFAAPTGSGFRLELAEGEGGRAGFDDD